MNRIFKSSLLLAGLATFSLFNSCTKPVSYTPGNPDQVFYGLSAGNSLLRYNTNNLSSPSLNVTLSGLQAGENLVAIDFRPATGQLYGLGSSSRIYVLDPQSGVCRAVGAGPFTPALSGVIAGFDFNPTVDRIRVVTSGGQNLRIHPETGMVAAVDIALNPGTPSVSGVAYTNSVAGASTTVLYDIDMSSGKLFKQDPPNNGALVEVGPLGIMPSDDCGFDISADNSIALAACNVGGSSELHEIDLATGKATGLGKLSIPLIGLAIPTMPVAYATDMNNNLHIFNFEKGGMTVSKAITGLQAGEMILGIDMRPGTGQLYALGSSSRLYILNMASGVATAVGMAPFTTLLSGTSFGFDFNPVADKIRIVSNTGQNLRVNPADGSITAVDIALSPGTPMVTAAAYTNNFAGSTSTTLYDLDASSNMLYKQSPPNDGALAAIGNTGIDFSAESGFDIGGSTNMAYAILTVGGINKVYRLDLNTGSATPVSDMPATVSGFAVGLGF